LLSIHLNNTNISPTDLLPQITSRGLHPQTLSAILSGTLLATRRAHGSPTAYRANPAAERARYSDADGEDGDQEWGVGVLRFGGAAEDEAERGFLSFFGVHGTSIYEVGSSFLSEERRERADGAQNNTLISGDNKGMAAYLYECRHIHLQLYLSFLAAFFPSFMSFHFHLFLVFALCLPRDTDADANPRSTQHLSSRTPCPGTRRTSRASCRAR
jgi:hypothetical protein